MSRTVTMFLAALLLAAACDEPAPAPQSSPTPSQRTYVGSDACASCHQSEYAKWLGSHHQLAMQEANSNTVLGDFSGTRFEYYETLAEFFRRDDQYVVRITEENGTPQEFPVSATFGVAPLQQYLVDFPNGSKQTLPFTWDARPQQDGGQRWYHLYPDEYIRSDDPLHWTGRYFRWNTHCAECHSTNLEVGYDASSRTFATTYAEISVGCEACHGPASAHIVQAESGQIGATAGLAVDLDDRADAHWLINPRTGIAERSQPRTVPAQQPESCGRCHARRGVLTEDYEYGKPLTDTHLPALLEDPLYYADGRIRAEVYVYGSFVQSRMYAAGVSCSDCHDPHSATLRTGSDPNAVCAQCHLPSRFAGVEHSAVDTGNCVDCHMPATTYMGVDDRRDHSFRVPETESDAEHYGQAIAAGRAGRANGSVAEGIAAAQFPAIARATLLTLLDEPLDTVQSALVLAQLDDPDPLVRIGALRALRGQSVNLRLQSGSQLLRDPVRGVRIEAVLTYMDYQDLLPAIDTRAYNGAADEYRNMLLASISDPVSALNLAEFETQSGNTSTAAQWFEHALQLDPAFAPVQHAYGLYLVRSGEVDAAIEHLHKAALLDSQSSRFAYVYGIALNTVGRRHDALEALSASRLRFPEDFDIAWALATMLRDGGNIESAQILLDEMSVQFPDNVRITQLIDSLATK